MGEANSFLNKVKLLPEDNKAAGAQSNEELRSYKAQDLNTPFPTGVKSLRICKIARVVRLHSP